MFATDAVLRLADQVRYRVVDGEGVVLLQETAEALVVNGVGARLLDLLDAPRTVGDLMLQLEAEYEVEPQTLARDVQAFLGDLVQAGVVEPASPLTA